MKVIFLFALTIGSIWAAPQAQHAVMPSSIIDDLLDFLKLIPVEDIKVIGDKYLAEDKEFCDVVRYLQGDDWAALVEAVASKPEWQEFKKYLTEAGIPVDIIIELIHQYIQNLKPLALENNKLKSLREFLDEVEAILPIDDLKALLEDKMANSPDFQELYKKVSSEEAHQLVEEVRALPEVQRIAQRLIDMGVKVEEALEAIYEFLGWGKPKQSLQSIIDDLLDFLKLIPVDKIKEISDKYLAEDKEFCDVVRYLQGEEWAAIVQAVADKPEWQDFKKYLTEAGLPVDIIIELIHQFIQNLKPLAEESNKLKSLRDYLDEVEATLPIDDLKALLEDKMANSPDFQELYAKVSSEKAHKLVEEVRALPEVQRIAQRLIDMGVKVEEALEAIYEFLGWGKP